MSRFLSTVSVLALNALPATAQEVIELDTITIFSNVAPIEVERSGASVTVLTGDDLADAPDATLADTLTRLPGVTLTQTGPRGSAADIRIRGARQRYVPVYIDGILVTDPSGTNVFYDDFGGLGTGNIQRVEVLKGSQSALYGGSAVGGVINITTLPDDAPEGLSGTIDLSAGTYGAFSGALQVTNRQGPLTLTLGLSHDEAEGFSAASGPNLPGAGPNDEADGFKRSRLSYGARYEVNSDLVIGINGFAEEGETEFDEFFYDDQNNNGFPTFNFADDVFAYVDGTPDEISERSARGLRVFAEFSTGAWDHVLALSGYRITRTTESPTVAGPDSTPFASRFEGERLSLDYSTSAQVNENWRLAFGVEADKEEVQATSLPGGSADITTRGIFAEAVWSPTDSFDLTGTLRHDDHSAFGGETTGRLAFSWRATEATTLRGAVATGYRPPSIDELFGTYAFFVGNPALEPERSRSAELGIDHMFRNGVELSATLFRIEIENLVTFQPGTFATGFIGTLVNAPGVSSREGLELSFKAPIGEKVEMYGAATYITTDDGNGNRLQRVPGREFLLGADIMLTERLDMGVAVKHVTDRPQDTNAAFARVDLDPYTLVDMRVAYDINDDMEAYLNVHNLTDTQYEIVPGYNTAGRTATFGIRAAF
ncbi:MAG: TonB-dependent receptor [Paracoccaceae bacterium]|nr:TonB-dependent receptor [Paracoccaceae bacterium]